MEAIARNREGTGLAAELPPASPSEDCLRAERPDGADELRATAYHEAGHAVAAFRFRYPIGEGGVSIDMENPGNGQCDCDISDHLLRTADSCRKAGGFLWDRWNRMAWSAAVVLIAGHAAGFKYLIGCRCPRLPVVNGLFMDMVQTNLLLDELYGSQSRAIEASDFSHRLLCSGTRRILNGKRAWESVTELSEMLVSTGHVSGEDAEALFRRQRVPRVSEALYFCRETPKDRWLQQLIDSARGPEEDHPIVD